MNKGRGGPRPIFLENFVQKEDGKMEGIQGLRRQAAAPVQRAIPAAEAKKAAAPAKADDNSPRTLIVEDLTGGNF